MADKFENDEAVRGKITQRVEGGLLVDIGVEAFLPGSQVELWPTRNLDRYIGQEFEFEIIEFDPQRLNIVLSRRALLEKEREKLKEGAIVEGIVKKITDYGAFVDLGSIDGLLHMTEMSWGRVSHPSELFDVGDEIQVKVLEFNRESERISLGYKQLSLEPREGAEERDPDGVQVLGRVVSPIDYGEDDSYRTQKLIAQRRGVTEEPATHLRHIGGLRLADPIVVVVNADGRAQPSARRALLGSARATFDNGATAVLDSDEVYEWVTFTSNEGGAGPIRKLEIQAGVGE
jgi:predicted RNA-binding protein with RPS1 domain